VNTSEQLALVVELAVLTEHRTIDEQAALLAVAAQLDYERNRQSLTNPRMPGSFRHGPNLPCTYSANHDADECICGGTELAHEPVGGWSRLEHLVRVTTKEVTP